ncbi:MAG: ParB/RepB/Spo0J family partition protein [Gammaproteobacteria bacterium]|nr:ParB/RepB/Spo0J family partition protein [Gammaproteobacteria bacterium]
MAVKKRGLGRGLDALLSGSSPNVPVEQSRVEGELRALPLDVIQRGVYQPRHNMHTESLDDLADSIRAQGVVQPIVVRLIDKGRYEIIAGERRWRAAQIAGLDEIPVVIRQVEDKAAIAMALIENIQREDLNPLEEARALQRLIEEFDMTHKEAAAAVGRSRTTVSNLLRLLDLDGQVKQHIDRGELEMGHARALLPLDAQGQRELAIDIVAKGLSVRQTEALVKNRLNKESKPAKKPAGDTNTLHLEQELSEKLGAMVKIQHSRKGKGKLTISYNSLEELDGVLERIR